MHSYQRHQPKIELSASNHAVWRANQCVTIDKKPGCVRVTSHQARSTPGIAATLYLKQCQKYTIRVEGRAASRKAKPFVWVMDSLTKDRLLPNYTRLPHQDGMAVEASFRTPASANAHVKIEVGVLLTGPPCRGDAFVLKRIWLTECGASAAPSHGMAGAAAAAAPSHGMAGRHSLSLIHI